MEEFSKNVGVFSPEGRLYQVEYAQQASRKGSTTCISKCKDGTIEIFYQNRSANKLHIPGKKINEIYSEIYSEIYAIFSGIQPDSLVLLDIAAVKAINNKLSKSVDPSISDVAGYVKNTMQRSTVNVSFRPFGVQCAVFGIDKTSNEPKLFVVEADGSKIEYDRCSIGIKSDECLEALLIDGCTALDALLTVVPEDILKIKGFRLTKSGLYEISTSEISSRMNNK